MCGNSGWYKSTCSDCSHGDVTWTLLSAAYTPAQCAAALEGETGGAATQMLTEGGCRVHGTCNQALTCGGSDPNGWQYHYWTTRECPSCPLIEPESPPPMPPSLPPPPESPPAMPPSPPPPPLAPDNAELHELVEALRARVASLESLLNHPTSLSIGCLNITRAEGTCQLQPTDGGAFLELSNDA